MPHSIKLRNCFSEVVPMFYVVPQDSVYGLLLLILYTTPLSYVIHSYKLYHHLYAHNTQVYMSLSTVGTYISLTQLGDCLSDITGWMTNNKLRLNADKTDLIIIGTSRQCSKSTRFFPRPLFSSCIRSSDNVVNLCVTFDSDINSRKHSSLKCRCCFYHIRYLCRICPYISLSVAKIIVQQSLQVDLITATAFFMTLHLMILQNLSVFRNAWLGLSHSLLSLLILYHSWNHFSVSLFNLGSFPNLVPLSMKFFIPENLRIYFPCFLLHPNPEYTVHQLSRLVCSLV